MKRNQQGFTLIELIVVIVILGVLAVTASPKFADLTGDAKAGTLGGVETAMIGALNLEYSRSLIGGGTGSYPGVATDSSDTTVGIIAKLDIDSADWDIVYDNSDTTAATAVRIFPSGYGPSAGNGTFPTSGAGSACYVEYAGGGKSGISIDESC
jgi:MSHA pilin protein MshA